MSSWEDSSHHKEEEFTRAVALGLFDYLRNHTSPGFLVIQDGKVPLEKSWPAPEGDRQFSIFVHGRSTQGALLEDVASRWRDPLFGGPAFAI